MTPLPLTELSLRQDTSFLLFYDHFLENGYSRSTFGKPRVMGAIECRYGIGRVVTSEQKYSEYLLPANFQRCQCKRLSAEKRRVLLDFQHRLVMFLAWDEGNACFHMTLLLIYSMTVCSINCFSFVISFRGKSVLLLNHNICRSREFNKPHSSPLKNRL